MDASSGSSEAWPGLSLVGSALPTLADGCLLQGSSEARPGQRSSAALDAISSGSSEVWTGLGSSEVRPDLGSSEAQPGLRSSEVWTGLGSSEVRPDLGSSEVEPGLRSSVAPSRHSTSSSRSSGAATTLHARRQRSPISSSLASPTRRFSP
jgi:hypothetical protein